MATKKASAWSKSAKSRKKSKPKLTLTNLNKGQRKINGRLYATIDLILDHLSGIRTKEGDPLKQARKLADAIPGIDPPGCQKPGGGGG